jgi:tungstate transport system ATP-binding protein
MSLTVVLKGLNKSYAGKEALKDISCEFTAGKIGAVIGPNGSGKTSLLRLISRLDRPSRGEIAYMSGGGCALPGISLMRRMTLVSQATVLFNTSLYNNIAYGLKARGLPPGSVKARVEEALAAVGLNALAHAQAGTLSGGEAQRAAFARAYALRPELALLDEPSANLDPDGVALMERLVLRMKEEYGTTFVIVTHNLFQARRLADRVFFLYGGELVESGDTRALFGSPKRELTRKFLSGEVVY